MKYLLILIALLISGCMAKPAPKDPSPVAESHYLMGNQLAKLQRYAEAEVEYQQAVALAPNYPPYLNGLGGVYLNQGKSDLAVAVYKKTCGLLEATYGPLASRLAGCYWLWGSALEKAGSLAESLKKYQAAYAADVHSHPSYVFERLMTLKDISRVSILLGKEEEAEVLYQTLLGEIPQSSKFVPTIAMRIEELRASRESRR